MSNSKLFDFMLGLVMLAAIVFCVHWVNSPRDRARDSRVDGEQDDAYILVKGDAVSAQWGYQQLPMHDCAWCGRTVNLNRHHVVPQSANPALRDVKENLIVLCRDCHFVLGHRCDWKRYNPDVLYICTHFTNCVRSADTRYSLTNETGRVQPPPPEISPAETPENKGENAQLDESAPEPAKLVH